MVGNYIIVVKYIKAANIIIVAIITIKAIAIINIILVDAWSFFIQLMIIQLKQVVQKLITAVIETSTIRLVAKSISLITWGALQIVKIMVGFEEFTMAFTVDSFISSLTVVAVIIVFTEVIDIGFRVLMIKLIIINIEFKVFVIKLIITEAANITTINRYIRHTSFVTKELSNFIMEQRQVGPYTKKVQIYFDFVAFN